MRTLFSIIFSWLICFTLVNVVAKEFVAKSLKAVSVENLLAMIKSPLIYLAGVLYVLCAFLYFIALSRLPLSTAGPVFMILGIVTTTVLGFVLFGEPVTTVKLLGAGVCLLGTVILLFGTPD